MPQVECLTFNPFQENTYVVYDETKECVIIDPGCWDEREDQRLKKLIEEKDLTPVRLLNTHGHLDHILGNKYVCELWNLQPEIHAKDLPILQAAPMMGQMYNIRVEPSPEPGRMIKEGEEISFGNTIFKVLFVPGHSPGHVAFYDEAGGYVISGDVLFYGSIGRYDFPNSNYEHLMKSLKEVMLSLPDKTKVYSGHGPSTTIERERRMNPFLQ